MFLGYAISTKLNARIITMYESLLTNVLFFFNAKFCLYVNKYVPIFRNFIDALV